MKGISVEEVHVVNALPPISLAGGKTSDYWHMQNYQHATILITLGAAVNVSAITVFQSESSAGVGEDAIPFRYYQEVTAAGDVLDRVSPDAAVGGFNSASAGTANTMYAIEVDAAELDDGHDWMCVKLTSAGAQLGAVLVILSGARYAKSPTMTAIT